MESRTKIDDYKISIIGKAVSGTVHIMIDYSEVPHNMSLIPDNSSDNCNVQCDGMIEMNANNIPIPETEIVIHRDGCNSPLEAKIPQTIIVNDARLAPNTKWCLKINQSICNKFTILGGPNDQSPRCIFKSCCGYKTKNNYTGTLDQDGTTLDQIGNETYDIMFHIGDQLYTDYIFNEMKTCDNEDLLAAYRNCYRTVFQSEEMKKILSKGCHFMMGDDHDQKFHNKKYQMHEYIDMPIAKAARKALHEYQMNLWGANGANGAEPVEANAGSTAMHPSSIKIVQSCTDPKYNLFLKFKNTQFILLDNRYTNVYTHDPNNPFMSESQIQYLHQCIQKSTEIPLVPIHSTPNLKQTQAVKKPDHYNNVIVTALQILANSKFGSWLKQKIDNGEVDDSTYGPNCGNTKFILRRMSQYSKVGLNNLWISGDLHHSSISDIHDNKGVIFKQIITSGVSESCTFGSLFGRVSDIYEWCFDYYRLGRFSGKNIELGYAKNYLIVDENVMDERDVWIVN